MRMHVSRETTDRLDAYQDLIRKWNPRINLVAPSTLDDLKGRHIDDCLQLAAQVSTVSGSWVDIGSGGGFPGIVLAIALADQDLSITLIESDQRKSTFLRTAIRELDLKNAQVLTARIERATRQNADYLSARALAPLPRLMPYLTRHLGANGQAWLMKGQRWQDEVDEARQAWAFDVESYESVTQPGAAILKISGVTHE
ncbi:16S rRNA (guanine(527)-N(7))-methyltransferase RsmG [Paracoccus homiensis]|uniref:16S rRNA (guanine(527)-N(7))-methyltransferase RsmG n=1 Tax=Paracoccus homiensis TaxID=364199 RepID=UPI00398CB405